MCYLGLLYLTIRKYSKQTNKQTNKQRPYRSFCSVVPALRVFMRDMHPGPLLAQIHRTVWSRPVFACPEKKAPSKDHATSMKAGQHNKCQVGPFQNRPFCQRNLLNGDGPEHLRGANISKAAILHWTLKLQNRRSPLGPSSLRSPLVEKYKNTH